MKHWPVYIIFIFISVFFVLCYRLVSLYYSSGLPYYDSVGVYWNMFHIMNTTRSDGFVAGFAAASGYSLSWLQPFFAVITAHILPNTPESFVSFNIFWLLIAMLTIYWCMKAAGYSKTKSFILAFLPLLPGVLMEWYGGYVDMRREASFVMVLTTLFFLTWIYVWKPSMKVGIVLGIVIGFSQWARGNSLPYVLLVFSSPCIIWFLVSRKKIHGFSIVKIVTLPLLFSLIFIAPFYYYAGEDIVTKYFHSSWQGGMNRLVSVVQFWNIPLILLLGTDYEVRFISRFVFILSFFIFIFLSRMHYVKIHVRQKNKRPKYLIISGILLSVFIFLFNVLVLGVGNLVGVWPFFPMLVGMFSALGGSLYYVEIQRKKNTLIRYKYKGLVAFILFIMAFSLVRIYVSMPPMNISLKGNVEKTAGELKNIIGGKTVAYLWLDHVHVHDLNFYITQQGGMPIRAKSILSPGNDTEMYVNEQKPIDEQQTRFYEALKNREFVVITDDTRNYEDFENPFFILHYGKPIVSKLLSDPKYIKVYAFHDSVRSYTVLKNPAYSGNY